MVLRVLSVECACVCGVACVRMHGVFTHMYFLVAAEKMIECLLHVAVELTSAVEELLVPVTVTVTQYCPRKKILPVPCMTHLERHNNPCMIVHVLCMIFLNGINAGLPFMYHACIMHVSCMYHALSCMVILNRHHQSMLVFFFFQVLR